MEIKTIEFLPTEQMKIVKEILIVDKNQDGNEFVIGSVMYERILSTDYKFIEVPQKVSGILATTLIILSKTFIPMTMLII